MRKRIGNLEVDWWDFEQSPIAKAADVAAEAFCYIGIFYFGYQVIEWACRGFALVGGR